ncbi:thymidine kinase [Candidatus Parcubacteria bacterium]|nr:thymidine kinase [Candidatus Parcubacteria bacterium]
MILREKYLECSDRELAEKWLPGRTENAIERRRARLGLTKKKKEISKNGRLEVITGPMFAGKTEELMRRLERARFAKKSFMTFKSSLDTRYDKTMIVSHSKRTMEAIPIPSGITCAQFFDQFGKEIEKVEIIAFDEAQFFRKKEFLKIIRELLRQGKRVIIAGLDLTFKGEPFGPMPELLALADEVIKLTAICEICGNPATKTQRLINGKPVVSGPTVIVGAKEGEITYRAVCNAHFIWK